MLLLDADVDGAHIRLLLLTFFYRYQREVIDQGFVYIACPPLYKLTFKNARAMSLTDTTADSDGNTSNRVRYFYSQEEYDVFVQSLTKTQQQGYTLQRFKGLGEMMPLQLWETTMNPATRQLKRVGLDDAADADKMFSILMGNQVQPRKEFIVKHADALNREDLDF
jgi:DNA gyrase subunit B